jgi:2-hydroxychromene-2-carboxylate isomerase
LPADLQIEYRPVLFAGLLGHWGQKGPAEIASKRRYTYRWCNWWAKRLGFRSVFRPGTRSIRCIT